jgi:hypothetical protein
MSGFSSTPHQFFLFYWHKFLISSSQKKNFISSIVLHCLAVSSSRRRRYRLAPALKLPDLTSSLLYLFICMTIYVFTSWKI